MYKLEMTRFQCRIVILGWVTYAAYYLGRVNLATALPAIQADLHWLPNQTSALAGAALWTYALGQLVSGWLAHKMGTRRVVFVGIVGSAAANLLFALTSSLPVMVILSLINGFMQSLGWGPILHTIGDTLSTTQRQRIAGAFGVSYVVGNAITWVLTAFLLSTGNWRLTFIIPPLLMFIVGIAWYFLSISAKSAAVKSTLLNWGTGTIILRQSWPVLVAALVAGALLNGALLYAPTYVAQTLPLNQAALTAIIFPLFGLLGTAWLGGWVLRRWHGNALRSLIVLLVVAALARVLALFLPPSTFTAVIILASMGITSYALTNVLLTAVPLTMFSHISTAVVAGMMDATHSIGGAIGSTLVGLLLVRGGWPLVFGMWILLPLLAIAVMVFAIRNQSIYQID